MIHENTDHFHEVYGYHLSLAHYSAHNKGLKHFSEEMIEFPWSDLIVKVLKSIAGAGSLAMNWLLDAEVHGCLPLPRTSPAPPQARSEQTPVAYSTRQKSRTANTRTWLQSCQISLLTESCPGLLQETAGAWEASAARPDVKVPHTHPLSQFIPSWQSQIIKPNEV